MKPGTMSDLWPLLAVLFVWLALQTFILPKFGVST
jgi:hypothetical protein